MVREVHLFEMKRKQVSSVESNCPTNESKSFQENLLKYCQWRYAILLLGIFICIAELGYGGVSHSSNHHNNLSQLYDQFTVIGLSMSSFKLIEFLPSQINTRRDKHHHHVYASSYTAALIVSFFVFLSVFLTSFFKVQTLIQEVIIKTAQFIMIYFILQSSAAYLIFVRGTPYLDFVTIVAYLVHQIFSSIMLDMGINRILSIVIISVALSCQISRGAVKIYVCWNKLEFSFSKILFHILAAPGLLLVKLILSVGDLLISSDKYCIRIHLVVNYITLVIALLIFANVSQVETVEELSFTLHNLESKNVFVKTISHEIRSPLSTVTLGVDLMIEDLERAMTDPSTLNPRNVVETLRDIKISCEIAINTLSDLLSLDKIQSKMMELNLKMTPVWNFVGHCLKPFYIQARAGNIKLVCIKSLEYTAVHEFGQELGVMIDTQKMEQVLRNFVSNAIKFSLKGGEVMVKVSIHKEFSHDTQGKAENKQPGSKGVLRISVQDNGPGISKENQKKLFAQYVQIDPAKLQNGKGSGLGLWLSKAIVDLHGGIVGVSSEGEGRGSLFFVELPCSRFISSISCKASNTLNNGNISMARIPAMTDNNKSIAAASMRNRTIGSVIPSALNFAQQQSTSIRDLGIKASSRIASSNSRQTSKLNLASPNAHLISAASFLSPKSAHIPKSLSRMIVKSSNQHIDSSDHEGRHSQSSAAATPVQIKNSSKAILALTSDSGKDPPKRAVTSFTKPRQLSFMVRPGTENLKELDFEREDSQVLNRKLNILLVDDDPISRKMVAKVLQGLAALCNHAKNGKEAFDMVKENLQLYDVILMDFNMPTMNGPDAVKLMREEGFEKIIFGVTGETSSIETDYFLNSGVDAVLEKPLNLASLRKVLNAMGDTTASDDE